MKKTFSAGQPFQLDQSDHRPLTIEIPLAQQNLFLIPIIKPEQIHVYLNKHKEIKNNQSKEYEIQYVKYNDIFNNTFTDELAVLKPKLFSKDSKQFHKFIQQSRNLNPFKKEGSIVNCIKHNGQMNLKRQVSYTPLIQYEMKFPQNFLILQKKTKAVSFDLSVLKYLVSFIEKEGGKLYINMDYIRQLDYSFSMRLVPLNKAHPNLPTIDEFPPIMVQSHFIKLIEAFFVPRFREICTKEINPSQIGFVKKMACQYHIGYVIEQLKKKFSNNIQPKSVIFLDWSNAYNSVDRWRLPLYI